MARLEIEFASQVQATTSLGPRRSSMFRMLGIVCTSILQRNKKIDYDASRERAIESVQFQRAVLFCSSRSHLGELLPGLGRWSGDPPHPRREARQRGALCCVRSRMKNTEQYVIISFNFHKGRRHFLLWDLARNPENLFIKKSE